jgi:hypothetical protein
LWGGELPRRPRPRRALGPPGGLEYPLDVIWSPNELERRPVVVKPRLRGGNEDREPIESMNVRPRRSTTTGPRGDARAKAVCSSEMPDLSSWPYSCKRAVPSIWSTETENTPPGALSSIALPLPLSTDRAVERAPEATSRSTCVAVRAIRQRDHARGLAGTWLVPSSASTRRARWPRHGTARYPHGTRSAAGQR